MKSLVSSLSIITQRKDSRLVIIFSTLCFLLLLLAVQNGPEAMQVLSYHSMSLPKRLTLFISILFDLQSTFTTGTLLLSVLGSFLGGINISLAYTYIRLRGEVIVKSGLYSGLGLFFAFVGIGCAACGTAFLSVLLGFFGFSTMLNILPYQGQEIGYIGLIFLCMATYVLAQKVTEPNVC